MTVRELIAALAALDPDLPVMLFAHGGEDVTRVEMRQMTRRDENGGWAEPQTTYPAVFLSHSYLRR